MKKYFFKLAIICVFYLLLSIFFENIYAEEFYTLGENRHLIGNPLGQRASFYDAKKDVIGVYNMKDDIDNPLYCLEPGKGLVTKTDGYSTLKGYSNGFDKIGIADKYFSVKVQTSVGLGGTPIYTTNQLNLRLYAYHFISELYNHNTNTDENYYVAKQLIIWRRNCCFKIT